MWTAYIGKTKCYVPLKAHWWIPKPLLGYYTTWFGYTISSNSLKGVDLTEFWIVQEVEPQFFGSRGVHVRLVGD